MKFKSLGLALGLVALSQATIVHAADNFNFSAYDIDKIHKGKTKFPDFKGRDKAFAFFKTRILDAMKEGVTFAGEFSITQFGCGTGCTTVLVANNRTGKVHQFPRGGEFNQGLSLEYKLDSRLMLARWFTDFTMKTCVIEGLLFDEGKWIAIGALSGEDEESCSENIAMSIKKVRGF